MVTANAHALGLQALRGPLLDELHLGPFAELIEIHVHQIVGVEVQLVAVGTANETVAFVGNQPHHLTDMLGRVILDIAMQTPA
jgi:hypothetical protein